MTLPSRRLPAIVLTLIIAVAVVYLAFDALYVTRVAETELRQARTHAVRVQQALDLHLGELETRVEAWARQPGILDERPALAASAEEAALDLLAVLDANGSIVFGWSRDLDSDQLVPLPAPDAGPLESFEMLAPPGPGSGVLTLESGPILTAAHSLMTDGANTTSGTLVLGRLLDDAELQILSAAVQLPVSLHVLNGEPNSEDVVAALQRMSPLSNLAVVPIDGATLAGYARLDSPAGEPVAVLRVAMERELLAQARNVLIGAAASAAVVGVLAIGSFLLAGREQRAQVNALRQRLDTLAENGAAARLDVEHWNELEPLAKAINAAIDTAAKSRHDSDQLRRAVEHHVATRTLELEEQRNFLETILDSMNEGVIYGTDDRIEYVNRMMTIMTGYDESELVGRPPQSLFGPESSSDRRQFRNGMTSSRSNGRALQRGERKLRCKDGSQIEVAYTVSPLSGEDSEGKRIYIVRDVSEEKILQARRDRFLAHASHELRTPLTNLMTRLYLLRRQPDEFYTHMEVLDNVAAHMKSLVEDLLDVSRFRKGTVPLNRERLELQPLIHEVIAVQQPEATRKKIALSAHVPEDPILVFADRKRMLQILTNLTINAINYTPEGGHVWVELGTEARDSKVYALVRVRDDGIGMDAESVAQIFQPFFRVSQETPGTGLGLAIVKEIVDHHGGEITVDSEPGKGSTFSIALQLITQEESGSTR